jgi:hypothetical protein
MTLSISNTYRNGQAIRSTLSADPAQWYGIFNHAKI